MKNLTLPGSRLPAGALLLVPAFILALAAGVKAQEVSGAGGLALLLSAGAGNTPDTPIPIRMKVNMAEADRGWAAILAVIQASGKYVDLDLSACTMAGTEFAPGAANTGGQYIAGLVLPNAAKNIKANAALSYPAFENFTNLRRVRGKA
jgi:hypothetical protein